MMQKTLKNKKHMNNQAKTWPAVVEATTVAERQNLLTAATAAQKVRDTQRKPVVVSISGIALELSPREASKMIVSHLTREHREHIDLCAKYARLGLQREAIIRTEFFKSIIAGIDMHKDLFSFETFNEDGMVLANRKNLSTSQEFFALLQQVESYICNLSSPADLDQKWATARITLLADQMKDDLWPKRTDMVKTTEMRRIPVVLPKAPERTKTRLIQWSLQGYMPKIIAHRNAVIPVVSKDYLRTITEEIQRILEKLDSGSRLWKSFDALATLIDEKFPTNILEGFIPSRRNDPILHVPDGQWTVIIDQYADFPKEKEIVQTIKDHYTLLGKRYGILDAKN